MIIMTGSGAISAKGNSLLPCFIIKALHDSELLNVSCGVPQWSILGPSLLIIYTNDLPNVLTLSKCILFADDTTLFYSTKNLHTLYNNISLDLNDLSEWFKANKLSLNVSKTNYITMQNTNEISINHTLKIGDETIKQVNTAKFLGIIIDDKLSWNAHIDYCKNKLSSGLYICNKFSKTYPFAKTFKISILHLDTSPLNIWTLTLGLYIQNTLKKITNSSK